MIRFKKAWIVKDGIKRYPVKEWIEIDEGILFVADCLAVGSLKELIVQKFWTNLFDSPARTWIRREPQTKMGSENVFW